MALTKIRTKYVNHNGKGKIVARGAGKQITIGYPHELGAKGAHQSAARRLAVREGWDSSDIVVDNSPITGYAFTLKP